MQGESASNDEGFVEWLERALDRVEAVAGATTVPGRWTEQPHQELEAHCRCLSCYDWPWAWEIAEVDGPDCKDGGCMHVSHLAFEDVEHMALNDPRTVLARVEAERRLLGLYVALVRGGADSWAPDGSPADQLTADRCEISDPIEGERDLLFALRLLAYGHRYDAEGYRDEWKPDGPGTV